ncbi:MAG: carbohydrate binding domain-containing protein [Ruminococcus sp.]|nr:carbohydrate binding domain-containing protein [Ruminococcus sp.]MEE0006976.1 carbohydrate binding domain-containing protein [Ruminococcus sp.]
MRKQTMRALSVLLCVLMTVSSFSVLTAFATENKTNNTQATDVNKNSTVVDVDGQKFGTGDLGKSDDDNAPTISSENQYYSIVAKEEGTTKAKAKAQALDGDSDLPSKVDNSQSKYFPPIKSQGSVGSCVAWAETYYQFSYTQNKKLNRTATYENSFSPLWTYNFTNFSDDIGSYDSATYSVLRNIGAPTIKNSPNITDPAKWTATKEAFDEAQKYKLSSYSYISTGDGETPITNSKSSNLDTVKTALINGEVLTFSTHASYGFTYGIIQKNSQVPENTKYAGQYIVPYLVSTRGGHRMTIVGYDDDIWYDINEDGKVQEGEKGAFKVANSWGDDWMNNGYIWISYDSINITSSVNNSTVLSNRVRANCIDNIARISVKPVSDCSNINLEYTLSSKSRNDIEIKIIAKNKATGSTYSSYSEPFETYSNYYVNNDYSFDGTKTEAKGTFTYDLNSIVENLNSNNVEDYTWTFSFQDTDNNDSTLSVSDVKIVDNNNNKTYKSDLNGTVKLNGNSKDITVNAGGTTPDKNAVTIYYKGYSSPYIHYQVGDGNWTTAPGKAMTPDTTVDGYTHTYTIDLGTSDYANVCFNDGNNNWDSKNGQNYKFKKGTYTFKNGVITPIAVDNNFGIKSFDITPADGKIEAGDYVSMKVTLKNATSGAVSKFTYLDSNNKEYTIYDYASVSGCSWQTSEAGAYKVRVYSKESYNAKDYVMAEKTVIVSPKKEFKIDNAEVFPSDSTYVNGCVSCYITASGGKTPYTYEFGYTQDGNTKTEKTTNSSYYFYAKKGGDITVFAKVTDADGKTLTKTFKPIKVNTLTIKNIVTSPTSPQYVGTKINIKADIEYSQSKYGRYNYLKYEIKKDGNVVETLEDPYNASVDWTPTEAGNYTITCNMGDMSGQSATKTVNYVVNKKDTTDNLVVIYYVGYYSPYIHYQVENGSWTNAPGYKMIATNEKDGYSHKYVINLGDKNYANVCFNDGNGNWDSNNGKNYRFNKGTYTFKNGVITPVEDDKFGIESFDITPADGKITVGDFIDMKVKLKNATSNAVSKFTYLDSNNHEVTIYDYAGASSCLWQFNKSGTYRVRVYSKESYGSTNYVMAEKTVTVAEKQPLKINQFNINSNTGSVPFCDNVNMSVNASGGKAPYQYEFAMNQYNTRTVLQPFSTKNTFTVIPEYIGNYNYEVTVKDATGATVTVTKSIYVAQACIDNLNISSSTIKVNDIVKFSADIKNLSSLVTYHDYTYTVTKDNKTETLTTNIDRTANWTPKEAGKYTMLLQIKHNGKYIAGRSIEVTVDKASENVVTIYYKGYSTPYIHYQVGNGSWTDAPGYKMTSTNEKTGYTHKYTIDLGTSTYANVCFNNGNGSWDSRNGQNYHFEKGTYTFSNGNMTKIAD